MERQITVAVARVPDLERAVAGLRRTAKRLGLEPPPSLAVNWNSKREVKQGREVFIADGRDVQDGEVRIRVVPIVDCVLTLPAGGIRPPGEWRVAGVIERVAPEGDAAAELRNEIFCAPADSARLEAYRHATLECEHCRAKRMRARTLIVHEGATGRLVQVGKECASAYVGDRYERDVQILQFEEFITTVLGPFDREQEGGFQGCGAPLTAWDAEEVMGHACACVRTRGWQPSTTLVKDPSGAERKERNPEATAAYVKAMLSGEYLCGEKLAAARAKLTADRVEAERLEAEIKLVPAATPAVIQIFEEKAGRARKLEAAGIRPPPYEITEADHAEAKAMIAWLAGQSADPEKDPFLTSLKGAFDPGWISEKRLSFAVSLVRAREVTLRRAEAEAKRALSQFVGTPGERREFTVTLEAQFPYDSDWGAGVIYKFRDEAGNVVVWKTGSEGLPEGNQFRIKATIKSHETYRDEKQSKLSRVKVLEVVGGPQQKAEEGGRIQQSAESGVCLRHPDHQSMLTEAGKAGLPPPFATEAEFLLRRERELEQYVEAPCHPLVRQVWADGGAPFASNFFGPGEKGVWFTDRNGAKRFAGLADDPRLSSVQDRLVPSTAEGPGR